ncbi:UNVERIFIED_CONTAM: glucokinase [Brevibacillus sp. OAP136]
MKVAIGIDIGGTKIRGGLVRDDGKVLRISEVPTHAASGGKAVMERIMALIDELGIAHACGIGVGATGQIGLSGQILSATSTFPAWAGIALRDELATRYGLPVQVVNDVQAMALGEQHYGSGRGIADFVCLALGTGVGGAIVSAGKLVRGANGAAGEIGHLTHRHGGRLCPCGKSGCLEAYVSGRALAERFYETYGIHKTASTILQEAQSGDPAAQAMRDEFVDDLSSGIASLATLLNPRKIIVGGGIAQSLAPFLPIIGQQVVRQLSHAAALTFSVELSELRDESMLLGAASLVFS